MTRQTSIGFPVTPDNPIPGGGSQEPSHTTWDWWADTFTWGDDAGGVGAPTVDGGQNLPGGSSENDGGQSTDPEDYCRPARSTGSATRSALARTPAAVGR
ncbi:MAG: hypothetical protein U5K70_04355 [Halodesulfurarchaeum sp.]|nr:hypothetical protein [Halodesulfurarchaeum sp.]